MHEPEPAPHPDTKEKPQVLGRAILVHGPRFNFEELTLETPDGQTHTRQHIRHPGAVCILPIRETEAGHSIVFVSNYRAALGDWVLELPAGTLEPDEDPADCAARELAEETGYAAATISPLGRFHTSPGLSDELMWVFVATGLRHVGQNLDPGEQLTVEERSLDEALRLAAGDEMTDAKSKLTLLLAQSRGLLGGRST